MKLTIKGLGLARRNLSERKKRMKGQRIAWTAASKLLERRYIRTWFKRSGALTTPGGGPKGDTWPGLTSGPYIAHKVKVGKNRKLEYDGTLRLSYFAKPLFSGKGLITGVRDTNRDKLRGLSGMGFNLMTLEDESRAKIFAMVKRYLETGKLF